MSLRASPVLLKPSVNSPFVGVDADHAVGVVLELADEVACDAGEDVGVAVVQRVDRGVGVGEVLERHLGGAGGRRPSSSSLRARVIDEPWFHSLERERAGAVGRVLEVGGALLEHGAAAAAELEGESVVGLGEREHHGGVVGCLDGGDAGEVAGGVAGRRGRGGVARRGALPSLAGAPG